MQGISRLALLAAGAALIAAPAMAQDDKDAVPLGTITLTASTEAVDVSRTGATVDVVTEEELDKAPLSFAGFLSTLPGVSMSANGGLGATTGLRLRGLPAYYTGTRIDGIDVTDPSGPQLYYEFGGLTTAGLSRIEVLRGSQSALYGSEAVAGVVDITSWRPEEDGLSGKVGLEAGSDASYSGTVSTGYRDDRTELAFTMGRTITDGVSSHRLGTEDDGFKGSSLSAYASHDLTETFTLGGSVIAKDSFSEFDNSTGDADNWNDGSLRGGRIFARLETGSVTHELSFSRMSSHRDVFEFGGHTYLDGDRGMLAYSGGWQASDALSLNWGLERKDEDFSVVSAWSSEMNGIRTTSAFAEVLYAPNETLDLSFALRHDDHSLFGGFTSGRAALAWRPVENWIVRAVASTGFRAPSPYELWSQYGDPTFQAEESRSLELGLERELAGGSLRATLFDTRIEDQIIFDPNLFVYRQIDGTTTSRGVELSGKADIAAGWSLFGSYTYADVVVDEAGSIRRGPRAPRHTLTLGVDGRITDRIGAQFTVSHVADKLDEFVDYSSFPYAVTQVKLGDYTVANLALTYDINDRTAAYLRVENLFDEDYQTVRNYGQPGRQVFLGVQAKF